MFGPSRCGKGTTALSLLGFKMKLVDVEDELDENPDSFLNETANTSVMAPVNDDDEIIQHEYLSHKNESHTFEIKNVGCLH